MTSEHRPPSPVRRVGFALAAALALSATYSCQLFLESRTEQCQSDADCSMGLTCIKATATDQVLGGGPAGGYCSKTCMASSDCPGQASSCLKNDAASPGICVLGCDQGPALMSLQDPLDPAKCYGRDDLRCQALSATSSVCLPTCGKDDQCPAGRVCDPRFAVCVDKANTGKAPGDKCDPKAAMPECAGVCLSITGGI